MATVKEVKEAVLHSMREYSNSGEVINISDNKDYLLSVVPLINLYQREIATTTNKIQKTFEISQNMPTNQLGLIYWEENQTHTNADKSYVATGSQAYSFQVSGYSTVYVEEETAPDVWATLVTITHTPTAGEGFVTYKGLTGVSDIANKVRIRFSGLYRYAFRWVALFEELYFSADEVPKFETYVPYEMPANFFNLDEVEWTHEARQYGGYMAYKWQVYENSKKRLLINWYEKGEFIIKYFAYPTKITEPSADNVDEQDAVVLEIAEETIPALVHKIASTLLRDENPYMADTFSNLYDKSMDEVIGRSSYNQGNETVISTNNW